jgi:hypothetical protein
MPSNGGILAPAYRVAELANALHEAFFDPPERLRLNLA